VPCATKLPPNIGRINVLRTNTHGHEKACTLGLNPTMRDPPPLRKRSGPIGDLIYPDRSNFILCENKNRHGPLTPHPPLIVIPTHRLIEHPSPSSLANRTGCHKTHPKILIATYLIRYFSLSHALPPLLLFPLSLSPLHVSQQPPNNLRFSPTYRPPPNYANPTVLQKSANFSFSPTQFSFLPLIRID